MTPPCLLWATSSIRVRTNRHKTCINFFPISTRFLMNTKFPIFLKAELRQINVFGGSEIAEEKLHFLLKSSPDAKVRVYASSFSEEVASYAQRHQHVKLVSRWWPWPWELRAGEISIIATLDEREVRWIERLCRRKGHLLNVADVPDRCDFFMGGIVTNGSLKIAISTDGKAPILAKRMREWLEDVLPQDVEESLDDLLQLRRELKGDFATKQATLRAMTSHFRNNPKGRAV